MARRPKIETTSETRLCPKCKRKTHGTFPKDEPKRVCIHCGYEYDYKTKKPVTRAKEEPMPSKPTTAPKKKAAKKTAAKKTAKKAAAKATPKKKAAAKKATPKKKSNGELRFTDTPLGFIKKSIMEGKLTDVAIWQATVKKFGAKEIEGKMCRYVNYARKKLEDGGHKPPKRKGPALSAAMFEGGGTTGRVIKEAVKAAE